MTTANELRQMYLDYFIQRNHTLVASSPIVPPDDPTMLFTSAGMVQFKPLWAGQVEPLPYTRATTCQKCLRAGGKGSDLENVGKTLRHHTFFEMLGNFSFGDYFKREALEWGWDFVLNVMKLPKDRLWATTFEEDPEAPEILEKELGFPCSRIIPLNAKENFWGPAGDAGACGPCSEIVFFMGSEEDLAIAKSHSPSVIAQRIVEEGDLFLEIWNMVFPQFNQQPDGSRPPLKYRGIDTGAGLERMTTALQFSETRGQIRTPYETDLLAPIVAATAEVMNIQYKRVSESANPEDAAKRFAVNAVSDHVRALTFALSEGIVPSNEGRGYVLRRILRRALRFSVLAGMEEPFMHRIVESVVDAMSGAYPELKNRPKYVAEVIRTEEERFLRTAAQGSRLLDDIIARAKSQGARRISGEEVFLLHATYGFPMDMTAEIAEDAGLGIDREGFAQAMKKHQEDAKKSWKGAALGEEADLLGDIFEEFGETDFVGYNALQADASVYAIIKQAARTGEIQEGDEATIVLKETPFYAESGGQVGDQGVLETPSARFAVADTQKTPSGIFLHRGKLQSGSLHTGDLVTARVDAPRRLAIMRNHTVTHLLQAALKQVVGEHITQAGSFVAPEGMRFDFSHTRAVSQEELRKVERFVNEAILEDYVVRVEVLPIDEARRRGAIAPFGEKYGHVVRVVQVGRDDPDAPRLSTEFCGGTHMNRTAPIGSFRITAESSVAAGIRRIEGVTGLGAYESWACTRDTMADLSRALSTKESDLPERVAAMQEEIKRLGRELKRAKQAKPSLSVDELIAAAQEVNGIKVIAARLEGAEPETLRAVADQIRDKAPRIVCVLGSAVDDKVSLLCSVSKSETGRIQAGTVIKQIAAMVGGSGGGRPDLAQAGGKQPEKLDEALAAAPAVIKALLKK